MWQHPIGSFSNIIKDTDEESTGKWLVPISFDDDEAWQKIQDNVANRKIISAKISSKRLDEKLGYHLVCVYTYPWNVRETLKVLREIGFIGELKYKSDRATYEDRDGYLYFSSTIDQDRWYGKIRDHC